MWKKRTDWQTDFQLDWLTDCLIDLLINWLIDWLIDWLTDWLIDWLTVWLKMVLCIAYANVFSAIYVLHIDLVYQMPTVLLQFAFRHYRRGNQEPVSWGNWNHESGRFTQEYCQHAGLLGSLRSHFSNVRVYSIWRPTTLAQKQENTGRFYTN